MRQTTSQGLKYLGTISGLAYKETITHHGWVLWGIAPGCRPTNRNSIIWLQIHSLNTAAAVNNFYSNFIFESLNKNQFYTIFIRISFAILWQEDSKRNFEKQLVFLSW